MKLTVKIPEKNSKKRTVVSWEQMKAKPGIYVDWYEDSVGEPGSHYRFLSIAGHVFQVYSSGNMDYCSYSTHASYTQLVGEKLTIEVEDNG